MPRGEDSRMTLIEHLTELRNRLIKSLAAVALGAVLAWILYPQIIDFLVKPLEVERLLQTDPLEGFSVRIRIATYGGIGFAMPVLLWQLWRFISPGLYSHEKRYAVPFVASALALFFLGAAIAFWTLPKALNFLASIGGENFEQFYSPSKYFTLIVYMMLAFGVGFEFPIVLIFLQMAGIVTTASLRSFRRYAIVGIAVLVAVATPSGDPISMLALTIPMVAFYEAAIVYGRIRERRARKATT